MNKRSRLKWKKKKEHLAQKLKYIPSNEEVAKSLAHEEMRLPGDFDYARVSGLSNEIRNKRELHRPQTLGQASRLQGMTPAAISILLVYLKRALLEAARPPA